MINPPLRFPVAHEYSAAIQNPAKMFQSADLKSARFQMYGPGCPKVYSGNFASTFVATMATGRKMAVRVFLKPDPLNRDQRYQQISAFLQSKRPPSFAEFRYLREELLSNGKRWPVIAMEWVDGETLDGFMMKAAAQRKSELLHSLRRHIAQVARSLEDLGCSHGDLNTGNVLVSDELRSGLKMVDYDGMFVPGMQTGVAGAPGEEGTPGTRHPRRSRAHFGPQIDRFSFIVIDVCAIALAELPDVWNTLNTDQSRLLFDESDFQNPSGSKAFQQLRQRGSAGLRSSLDALARVASGAPEACPSLFEFHRITGATPAGSDRQRVEVLPIAATSVVATPAASLRLLERPAIDGSSYQAMKCACDSEIDMVGRIYEEPSLRTDCNGQHYLFVNLRSWKHGQSVRLTIWGDADTRKFYEHASLIAKVGKGEFQGKWICVTGTPQYFKRHDSVDIAPNSMGHIRFISAETAADMLQRTGLGQVRGLASINGLPAAPATGSTTGGTPARAAAAIQADNDSVLAALRAGSTPKELAEVAGRATPPAAGSSMRALATPAPAVPSGSSAPGLGQGTAGAFAVTISPPPNLGATKAPEGRWIALGVLVLVFLGSAVVVALLIGVIGGCSPSVDSERASMAAMIDERASASARSPR